MGRQQLSVVQQALADSTSNYDEWSALQDFKRAQRQGKVQYVVHVHTGVVKHKHAHEHIHYDGGKLPDDVW